MSGYISANNTSGFLNVSYEKGVKPSGQAYENWVAIVTHKKRRRAARFSVFTYGDKEAKALAIKKVAEWRALLDLGKPHQ